MWCAAPESNHGMAAGDQMPGPAVLIRNGTDGAVPLIQVFVSMR
jgi:hypothetical protein